MKYFVRFFVIAAIIVGFVFLKAVFSRWEELAQADTNVRNSDKLYSILVESACREDGIVTKCFKVTSGECTSVQLAALDSCVSKRDKAVGTMDRAEYVNHINEVSSCGFQAFLKKHMSNLDTDLEECRSPDMSKLFEIEKVLAQLSKQ